MTTPRQSRRVALAKANSVRLRRAALKRQITAGELAVADLLEALPPELDSMTIGALLCAQHRWGRFRALRLLSPRLIAENCPLSRLSARQRRLLVADLRARS